MFDWESLPLHGTMTGYNKPLVTRRADPYVCKSESGIYYFTGSYPAYDRILLRSSDTLDGLADAPERLVWQKHESGPMSWHIWAPELHRVKGKWYIYFAAGERDDVWRIRPYVLACDGEDPMTDTWRELGSMKACDGDPFSFGDFSLDATILHRGDEDYYIWAQKAGGISNLYIARMAAPDRLATVQVQLTTPDYDWERVAFWVNEGPAVLKHAGKLYLTYSASGTGSCYCVGMLTADEDADLLEPHSWQKERYPVLKTDPAKGIYGPGHNSFTVDEQGRDVMIFHARTYDGILTEDPLYDPNRHAMKLYVTYDEQGKPQFIPGTK